MTFFITFYRFLWILGSLWGDLWPPKASPGGKIADQDSVSLPGGVQGLIFDRFWRDFEVVLGAFFNDKPVLSL